MKKAILLACLLAAGTAAGIALASTASTGTVSVCATATATAATHTVAVDGSGVSTVGGDTATNQQCATTTYTIPTVTQTVTVAGSAPTYDSEISYTQNHPAFTPTSTVNVANATDLKNAIANLQPGELVQASAPFTVSGGGTAPALSLDNKNLSGVAVIDLTGVSIVYTGGQNYPAVDLSDSSNLRIYNGDLSTADTGGVCLNLMASSHILWWGFTAHDCGSTALRMMTGKTGYTSSGPVEYNDIQGEVWKFGQNTAWSTHTEPCTGLHGANLADGNYFPFDNNRVAVYAHDSACEGAGMEFGASQSTNIPTSNTIYMKCVNLTYDATNQAGGNCFQTWGYGITNTDIRYLEADNLAGHAYFAGGLYNKPNSYLNSDTLEYGRATNVRQNSLYANDPNWDPTGGTVFQDVSPLP